MHRTFYLSYYVLLDAWRSRLHWIVLGAGAGAAALGIFLSQLGVTESDDIQVVTTAATIRLTFVFVMIIWASAHVQREQQDFSIHVLLALPLRRSEFVLAKIIAFAALSGLTATAAGTLLSIFTPNSAIVWTVSLGVELWLVSAGAFFCAMGLRNLTGSIAAVASFYLLSRSITAMVLMTNSALLNDPAPAQQTIARVIAAIAYLLPPLDQFTASGWLIHDAVAATTWIPLVLQALIYILLLAIATVWDLQRKQL